MESNSHQPYHHYHQQQPQQQQQQTQPQQPPLISSSSSHHLHHHQPPQPSRPPSVDSVHLGSIYSGFYPQASSTGPTSLTNNIPNANGSYQSPYHSLAQQYHSIPPNYGSGVGSIPSSVYQSPQQHQQPTHSYGQITSTVPSTTVQQPQSLPTNLSYHYQLSAAAAAAAAFGFQQQHQQSNVIQSPTSQPVPPVPPATGVVYPGLAPSSTIPAWPPTPGHQIGMANSTGYPSTGTGTTLNNEMLNQYYLQYFREYYQMAHRQLQQQSIIQKKIVPFKYNGFHMPTRFSENDNQLVIAEPNALIGLYSLHEVFTEQCYPHLFLQPLLFNTTTSGDINSNQTLLPFNDSQSAIDWIRVKQLNDSGINYELKLILKVITMLFRQNGSLSGLDLSELLLELVSPPSDDSEKASQSGSEAITKDYYRDLLSHLRQLLMRGQRRVAVTFAQNNGLFDHALALSYLLSFLSNNTTTGANIGQLIDNGLMISTIRKFITTNLSTEDPLYVFYTHLLQIATNVVNTASESGLVPPAPASSAKIDKLESFIILLANEIKFDKVEISDKSYRNLIDLMISLLKDDFNYVLPDELFNNDRFDCLLVNECLEYARFHGQKLNPRLILRKLEFAFELFDFGFIRQATNYLQKIKTTIQDPKTDWKLLVDEKSKYCKFFLPESVISNEEPNIKLLRNIWLYQMKKIFNRINFTNDFDYALFSPTSKPEEESLAEDENDQNGDEEKEEPTEDNDETELVGELDDEEADVELETSESSISKKDESSISSSLQPNNQQTLPANIETNASKSHSTPVMEKSSNSLTGLSPIEPLQQKEVGATQSPFPPVPTSNSQGSKRSLPNIPNYNFSSTSSSFRSLNPIMEVPNNDAIPSGNEATKIDSPTKLQRTDSLDSSSSVSRTDNSFKMNSLQSALPSFPINNNNNMNINNNLNYGRTVDHVDNSVQPQPTLFQPLPAPVDSSLPTFDFVSNNGRVSSIPAYDPISTNDNEQTTDTNSFNHKNNEFLQNYNSNTTANHSNNVSNSVPNNKIDKKEASNGESAKSSPSKSNNGGLLNAILGRLKPKNQMILPDDTDPQIIYDPVTKRWIDKSAGDQGSSTGLPPPPPKLPVGAGGGQPFGFSSQSLPNSTLTSPTNQPQFPPAIDSPSLKNISENNPQPQQQPQQPPLESSIANGGTNIVSNTPFGSFVPPPSTGSNTFRSDIRRKRYIDVFNAPK